MIKKGRSTTESRAVQLPIDASGQHAAGTRSATTNRGEVLTMTDTRSRPTRANVVLLIPGVIFLAFGLSPGPVQAQNYVNDPGVCLDCHDDMGAAFERNVHSRLKAYDYPGSGTDCEACHGPGGNHVDSEDPADILNPAAALGGEAADVCIACHKTGEIMRWDMSAHAASDLACQSCHQMHGSEAKTALLIKSESETCFGCHEDTRDKFQLPSHHPIREGFMTCHDCHDPHSGKWTDVEWEEMSNELCFRCHGDKVGPYVFEHSPVEEDCSICHDVHGTVAASLLRQSEPFLCMQCHQPHFHTGLRTIDGAYAATDAVIEDDPGYAGLSGMSTADGFKRAMMTKCTQCHQEIHGTDLPSQSITGQGRALNR